MERVFTLNFTNLKEKPREKICEIPQLNRAKPIEMLRISENCKKHIRRDGRK